MPGMRGRLGRWCYRTGLLRGLQRARRWWRRDVRVLAYHRVLTLEDAARFGFDLELVSASVDGFRRQMQWLSRRFRPMRLGDVVSALEADVALPADAVVVTFDDGYDDNYHNAFPILRELQVPATFFVSTGHIDSGLPYAYDWLVHMILYTPAMVLSLPEIGIVEPLPADRVQRRQVAGHALDHLKAMEGQIQTAVIQRLETEWDMPRTRRHADCQPMNWNQLREMHAAGFEIGSHGVHHRMLAKLSADEMERELRDSKATLERELGAPASLIAYPVGGNDAFDGRVTTAAKDMGYRAGCSYIRGTNDETADPYALHRLAVEREMDTGWFAAMLTLPEIISYPSTSRAH
ncbi:MAG: polysaccharide deacetylase [Rhodanobacter sp.]|nr:MAG: polysaccharide deacetylase [Rhodanobacter sp.]TAM13332.1 MAG: polysaccharide deacetylase [Rhodanobacter sp.]TAM35109.1 MAG: polysaccharide deacetylase [Rhodanobacter sp.]